MAKYSADIEIAVRGGQQVDGLIKNLNRLNNSINVVNRNAKLLEGKGFNVASMENYSRAVLKAENAIRKAAQGTQQEEQAVRALVTAMDAENKARARRNFLIAQEVASRRQVIATANAGFGMQGPQAAAIRAGRGPASPIRGTANMPGSPAALASSGRGISGRLGGAISGSIIGGAFPLLFGQGGGAATGGAIGGLVGGLAGPGGSFAGSLLGTLLGDIASRGQAVKQLAEDIGFSAQQTKQLSDAFKVANTDVEKFTAVIQNIRGVGLEIEDQAKAIQLVTRLTELYGGSFEKTGNAITSALESGKVTQAILNQLTSQGINIQQALADKYRVNRDAILAMAKDGKISVQDLVDTLVDLGNKSDTVAKKQQNVFEAAYQQIASAAGEAANTASNSFTKTGGTLQQIAADIQSAFTAMFGELIRGTSEFILGLGEIARIAGSALDGVAAKFIEIQYGIIGAAKNLPVLDSGIIEFAKNALAVLNPVGFLIDKIREAGRNSPQKFGPEPPPVTAEQIRSFRVPSQAAPSGGGGKTKKDTAAEEEARMQARLRGLAVETSAIQKQQAIKDQIIKAEIAGDKQLVTRLQGEERSLQIIAGLQSSIIGITDQRERQALIAKTVAELDATQAQTAGELAKIDNARTEAIQDVVDGLDMELLQLEANTDAKKQALQFIQIENQLKSQGIKLSDADAETIRRKLVEIQKLTKVQEAANAKIQMEKELFEGIAGTLSGAVSGAIDAAVKGTESLGEALQGLAADMVATIGKMLIIYGIAQALGALAGGANDDKGGILTFLAKAFGYKAAKDGAYWEGGFQAFADGGMVTKPTMGLIGEGGEPEYVIPASKMRGAMSRYAAGARGSSVIPAGGEGGTDMGAPAAGGPAAIDVRYTVERINSVDYVTADQFQAGMRQAAAQGAAEGQRQTLRRLQQSPSTRRRVGV